MAKRNGLNLTLPTDCLVAFIDDTGHETFAGNQHYYGLGGCAVMVEGLPELQERWKRIRTIINGSPNAPLHASEMEPLQRNYDALSE